MTGEHGVGRTAFLSILPSAALLAQLCQGQRVPEVTTVLMASRIMAGGVASVL